MTNKFALQSIHSNIKRIGECVKTCLELSKIDMKVSPTVSSI